MALLVGGVSRSFVAFESFDDDEVFLSLDDVVRSFDGAISFIDGLSLFEDLSFDIEISLDVPCLDDVLAFDDGGTNFVDTDTDLDDVFTDVFDTETLFDALLLRAAAEPLLPAVVTTDVGEGLSCERCTSRELGREARLLVPDSSDATLDIGTEYRC